MSQYTGVALVTGAASGIGRATAIAFAQEGCTKISICDRNLLGLQETQTLISEISKDVDVLVIEVDMLEESQIDNMVKKTVERWGRVDYAVNAAGIIGNNAPSTQTTAAQFDLITNINYRGTWLSSRFEIAQMQTQTPLEWGNGKKRQKVRGSIVNIASQLGLVGRPDAPAYCASKAAVIAFTRGDSIDYAKDDIRVNCVCPGVTETPMTQGEPKFREALKPAIDIAPMKRMGTPEEIADACLFLCGSGAGFVCGHALVVDGGYIIN